MSIEYEYPKNLRNRHITKRFVLTVNIDGLNGKAEDVEMLTLLLVSAALLGDDRRYQQIFPKTLKAVESAFSDKSFQALAYGRVLFAADSIGDQNGILTASNCLRPLLEDPETSRNAFYVQALAFLASISNREYLSTYDSLNAVAKEVNDPMGWVIKILAASQNMDKASYRNDLQHLKAMTNQETVVQAVTKKFQRSATPPEYPGWALSILLVSAATIIDKKVYDDTKFALQRVLEEAKKAGALLETVLAQVNLDLGTIRWEMNMTDAGLPTLTT